MSRCSSNYAQVSSAARLTVYIYIVRLKTCKPYYDGANLVTVTDQMPCGYERTAAVIIRHQVSRRAAQRPPLLSNHPEEQRSGLSFSRSLSQISAEVSGAQKFDYSISQISEHPGNALAESESTLLSSRGVWEHLEVLRSTGEVTRSVWEDCVLLPDRFTFC